MPSTIPHSLHILAHFTLTGTIIPSLHMSKRSQGKQGAEQGTDFPEFGPRVSVLNHGQHQPQRAPGSVVSGSRAPDSFPLHSGENSVLE